MDILIIVAAQLLLLLASPRADGLTHIAVRILAADHEADLPRRVGGNGGIGVFCDREDFLAGLLQVGNESEVKPLVFRY